MVRLVSFLSGALVARFFEDESCGLEAADYRGLQAFPGGAEGAPGRYNASGGVRHPGAADHDDGPRPQGFRDQETEISEVSSTAPEPTDLGELLI